MDNPTVLEALCKQANAIYAAWVNGDRLTAEAMLHQVPQSRVAYVTFTATMLAVHEGQQYAFLKFIERATS